MMRMSRLPASVLFLLLCLQVIVPAQVWHELCDHHDTHSCQSPQEGLTISVQHVHCLVLELKLPGMLCEEQGFRFTVLHTPYAYHHFETQTLDLIVPDHRTVRGPPRSFFFS